MGENRPYSQVEKSGEVTEVRPQHQFYGRRKGKPLRRLHSQLMETLLPQVAVDITQPLAQTPAPRILEIGFGGGEHLAHQAAISPTVNFIGAEPFLNGVAKILAEIDTRKLTNLRIHYGDARPLLEALPAESFERIYLLYPDPWPKLKQKKRRFVNATNLAHFARVLRSQGQFWFASDIDDYVEWTRDHVAASKLFVEQPDHKTPFENWVQTRYETKARREGRGSTYLRFNKS